jgi:uncharacterized YigZ family protein
MASADTYKTIKAISNGLYKARGSRFISAAYPVSDESAIKKILGDIRKEHHGAKHHCYAYTSGMAGEKWRTNDDGEPPGTAGKPILGQIQSRGLTNVLIVVSRYFGGTLLGVGGLINAYRSAAASVLSNSEIIDHIVHCTCEITYPFEAMNNVMRILKEEGIKQDDHRFDLRCRLMISFRASVKDRVIPKLERVEGLTLNIISTS